MNIWQKRCLASLFLLKAGFFNSPIASSIILFLFLFCSRTLPAVEAVHFADEKLKICLEQKLGTVNPTASQMAALTELKINQEYQYYSDLSKISNIPEISNLTGLEYAINLRELQIYKSKISDISVLSKLVHLEFIDIRYSPISDISALSKLQKLKTLYIVSCNVQDLSPLKEMSNLSHLSLCSEKIENISVLSGMKSLTGLNLSDNNIRDISPLSGLCNLSYLSVAHNQIEDLSGIAKMANLKSLCLYDNKIKDLSVISQLTQLDTFDIRNNPIRFGYLNPGYISLLIHNRGIRSESPLWYTLSIIIGVISSIVFCAILIKIRKHLVKAATALHYWFKHSGCEKCAIISPVISIACLCFGIFCLIRLINCHDGFEGVALGAIFIVIYPICSWICGLIALLGLFGEHKKKRIALISLSGNILLPIFIVGVAYIFS